jgi:hypothetical protein
VGLLLRVETLRGAPLKRGYAGDLFVAAEESLHEALDRYAAAHTTRTNTRRRLFVDDSAQGLGLIGLATSRYDVVLMNPPFGSATLAAKKAFERLYPHSKDDVYAAFVERGIQLLSARGRVGAITSRAGFFLSRFQSWREDVLKKAPAVIVADLGAGVLDSAMVETAAYCLEAAP